MSKPWGRLHKFLRPSQKSWTLVTLSDTNKHLLCASLCNSVALLFFLCPSRSAGPVTKLAHLFLSALFKKAAVSRKSCTFQMLLAWNGPLIIVVLHALLVPLFLSPFSFSLPETIETSEIENWGKAVGMSNFECLNSYLNVRVHSRFEFHVGNSNCH